MRIGAPAATRQTSRMIWAGWCWPIARTWRFSGSPRPVRRRHPQFPSARLWAMLRRANAGAGVQGWVSCQPSSCLALGFCLRGSTRGLSWSDDFDAPFRPSIPWWRHRAVILPRRDPRTRALPGPPAPLGGIGQASFPIVARRRAYPRHARPMAADKRQDMRSVASAQHPATNHIHSSKPLLSPR